MTGIVNYSEAHDEAERLSRNLRRDVEVKPVACACDYDKRCFYCRGEGLYYELVYSGCGHSVQDGPDLECEENDCADKERLAEIKRLEVNDERAA